MMATHAKTSERRTNPYMAGVVELGICYKATLGVRIAMVYFHECGVPQEVAERVIGASAHRKGEHDVVTNV